MKNKSNKKVETGFFNSLLNNPTVPKTSGFAFFSGSVLPIGLMIPLVVFSVFGLLKEGYNQENWYRYFAYCATPVAFAVVTAMYFRISKQSVKKAILAQKCKLKYFLWAIVMQIGLWSLSVLNELFLIFLSNFGYQDPGIQLPSTAGFGIVGVLFCVAVLPAVFEEIFFRGIVLKGLKGFSFAGQVLLCGGLFAVYHQNPAQTIYQFCCGVAFALVALRANSILPSVLSHFLNNAAIILLNHFGVVLGIGSIGYNVILAVAIPCLILSIGYLLFFDKQEKKEDANVDAKADRKDFFVYAAFGIAFHVISWLSVLLSGFQ